VIQDLLDRQRILNTRDNLDLPCTPIAGRDINIKHSLESLRALIATISSLLISSSATTPRPLSVSSRTSILGDR
jgi:hypothetical protein